MSGQVCPLIIAFHVSRRRPEMYCGHAHLCVCVCVCLSVCVSAATCPHYCTDPDVTWRSGRGCLLVVHYWSDLQSVHGLHCYGKITQTRNVSKYMLVLALCLVGSIKEISVHVCVMICHLSTADELVVVL